MQTANTNLALAASSAEPSRSPSHFRETATVASLVSPVSEEEFYARYWEKKPLIIDRQNPHYYGDLFTLRDFDESVTRGPSYVKTAEATANKHARHEGATPSALEGVLADMRDGHTLILDRMQHFDPKLKGYCGLLAQETRHRFQTNIYLTPPNGKGFRPHWDNHDVFVLQVLGSKHWKVERDRRTLPEKDGSIDEKDREFRGEVEEFTLRQGDMVYIPRGFVHAAECGSESSLHITLGTYPNTWDEMIYAAIKTAIRHDENLRLALPVGHTKGDGAGIVKRVADVLRAAADPAFLAEVFERYRDEMVKRASLDISGQIVSFFEGREMNLDDRYGVRPGLIYSLRAGEGTVILYVGTRVITFPDIFGEALKFALEKPDYAVRQLPGNLEDEEKLVFVERLMQEGLLVHA